MALHAGAHTPLGGTVLLMADSRVADKSVGLAGVALLPDARDSHPGGGRPEEDHALGLRRQTLDPAP